MAHGRCLVTVSALKSPHLSAFYPRALPPGITLAFAAHVHAVNGVGPRFSFYGA